MTRTPLEAFNRFLEFVPDLRSAFLHTSEEHYDLLDAFLTNPGKHRKHVRLISEVAHAVELANRFPLLDPTKSLLRYFGYKPKLPSQYFKELEGLKRHLLDEAQPCAFSFDLLPSRLVDTPSEWASSLQLLFLQARIAVYPLHGLVPEKISLSLTIKDEGSMRFSDCFPSTEFSEAGEYEVGLTTEGRFVRSVSAGGSIEAKLKMPVASLSGKTEAKIAGDSSRSEKLSYRLALHKAQVA